jgi:hypothetical protein
VLIKQPTCHAAEPCPVICSFVYPRRRSAVLTVLLDIGRVSDNNDGKTKSTKPLGARSSRKIETGLARERNNVLLPHLHARGWEAPLAPIEVKFRPLRPAKLSKTHEDKRRRLQSSGRDELPLITVDRAEQCTYFRRVS